MAKKTKKTSLFTISPVKYGSCELRYRNVLLDRFRDVESAKAYVKKVWGEEAQLVEE